MCLHYLGCVSGYVLGQFNFRCNWNDYLSRMILVSVVESTSIVSYIMVYIPTFILCACLFVYLFAGNVKCMGYKRGAMICEGILCKMTNVVQNHVSWICMFHNKLGYPSHVKVTTSFLMCFGRHPLVVVATTTPVVISHVVLSISFFFSMFLCVSSCGNMYSNFRDFLQSFSALAGFATS